MILLSEAKLAAFSYFAPILALLIFSELFYILSVILKKVGIVRNLTRLKALFMSPSHGQQKGTTGLITATQQLCSNDRVKYLTNHGKGHKGKEMPFYFFIKPVICIMIKNHHENEINPLILHRKKKQQRQQLSFTRFIVNAIFFFS